MGTMRSCRVLLRISSIKRPTWWLALPSARWRVCCASIDAPALAITSSPSRLITASSRSACTRMKRWSSTTGAAAAPASRPFCCLFRAAVTTCGLTPVVDCSTWPRRGAWPATGSASVWVFSACCSCARVMAPACTRMSPMRGLSGMASICRTRSCGDAPGSSTNSRQSSRTKVNAASICARVVSPSSRSSKVRWQVSGSSSSNVGTASRSSSTRVTVPSLSR